MAAMTTADGVVRVLEAVGRVSGDTQCPAVAITRRLDTAYRRLRARLSQEFPTLYETTAAPVTLSGSTVTIAKPSGCESVRILEKQSNVGSASADWYPLQVLASLNRNQINVLSFYEQGTDIVIAPPEAAPGVYRLTYDVVPIDGYTTYDVPAGMEDILVEEVAAWVRVRHEEDPTPHKMEAARIWDEQYMRLWNRYGSHGQSGLQITRGN